MQYIDALEGLRSQGFPNEKVTVRRYEIMRKFIEGVSYFKLKRNLALKYAQGKYVEAPPTVEAHARCDTIGKPSRAAATSAR